VSLSCWLTTAPPPPCWIRARPPPHNLLLACYSWTKVLISHRKLTILSRLNSLTSLKEAVSAKILLSCCYQHNAEWNRPYLALSQASQATTLSSPDQPYSWIFLIRKKISWELKHFYLLSNSRGNLENSRSVSKWLLVFLITTRRDSVSGAPSLTPFSYTTPTGNAKIAYHCTRQVNTFTRVSVPKQAVKNMTFSGDYASCWDMSKTDSHYFYFRYSLFIRIL